MMSASPLLADRREQVVGQEVSVSVARRKPRGWSRREPLKNVRIVELPQSEALNVSSPQPPLPSPRQSYSINRFSRIARFTL